MSKKVVKPGTKYGVIDKKLRPRGTFHGHWPTLVLQKEARTSRQPMSTIKIPVRFKSEVIDTFKIFLD